MVFLGPLWWSSVDLVLRREGWGTPSLVWFIYLTSYFPWNSLRALDPAREELTQVGNLREDPGQVRGWHKVGGWAEVWRKRVTQCWDGHSWAPAFRGSACPVVLPSPAPSPLLLPFFFPPQTYFFFDSLNYKIEPNFLEHCMGKTKRKL